MFTFIYNNIEEIKDDKYDFYSYCLRNNYLKSLAEMIKFNDSTFKN